jgi:hypothetical protein
MLRLVSKAAERYYYFTLLKSVAGAVKKNPAISRRDYY